MQRFMKKLAARFVKPTNILDLQQDKKSFSDLYVSLSNQKHDINLHTCLVTKSENS